MLVPTKNTGTHAALEDCAMLSTCLGPTLPAPRATALVASLFAFAVTSLSFADRQEVHPPRIDLTSTNTVLLDGHIVDEAELESGLRRIVPARHLLLAVQGLAGARAFKTVVRRCASSGFNDVTLVEAR